MVNEELFHYFRNKEGNAQKELRLGNYLMYRGEKLTRVQALGENGFATGMVCDTIADGCLIGSSDIFDYEPIPLTAEWLQKLGFKRTEYKLGVSYVLDDYNQYLENGDIYVDGDFIPTVRIVYVHQFQNLFFLLTESELEIK